MGFMFLHCQELKKPMMFAAEYISINRTNGMQPKMCSLFQNEWKHFHILIAHQLHTKEKGSVLGMPVEGKTGKAQAKNS